MNRKTTLSIALFLSFLLAVLTSSDSQAQGNRRFVYDSGMITLGQNQTLRISVNGMDGNDRVRIQFRQIGYGQQSCHNGGVCKVLTTNEVIKETVFFSQNEGVWVDIDRTPGESGVRGIVTANQPVRVNAQIIDMTTGEVQSITAILIG